jgi:hypothetical protein
MQVIAAEGADALEPDEQALMREAADALFFCEDISLDDEAAEALTRVGDLAGELVGAERWDPGHAERVLADFEACGPAQLVQLGER